MPARITNLPSELIWEIARRILTDDGVYYVYFRAACKDFWSFLPDISKLGFSFLLRSWIMLYNTSRSNARIFQKHPCFQQFDESGTRIRRPRHCYVCINELDLNTLGDTYQNCIQKNETLSWMHRAHCSFLHLRTGRCVTLVLPELETHSIMSATDGLFVLVNDHTRTLHLFNPLTRLLSDGFPLALATKGIFNEVTAVAPSSSMVEQPTLMIARYLSNSAIFAKPGEKASIIIQLPFYITSALFFKGRFYCTDFTGSIWEIEPKQKSVSCVFSQNRARRCWELVQTRIGMLLIDSSPRSAGKIDALGDIFMHVYRVDLSADTIIPTNYTGNFAISVADTAPKTRRVLSVTPTTNNYIDRHLLLLWN
ncbi:hypothetical protein LUZ61_017145 [Rhynchospora tenuis]|uniref:KIB1-4 beta-propeller domain-containing protein n=1 Tax=Rhynchospora tenuis TaxID=198213 RepID=A0AAD5Z6V0_9POAL|nr:hypothetical protein LUZ61_017145 [Rhynchospora tenuis]